MENETPQQKSFLESVSFYIFLALAFLLPLFFLKGSILQFSKSILASLAVLLVLLVWSIAKLKQGRVTLYLNWISWGGIAVGLSSLLSSIFSPNPFSSFIGQGFEVGTFMSTLLALILLFLTPHLLRTRARAFYFYVVFFASLLVFALYELIRLFAGADTLSFGVFTTTALTLIGKWNDMGLFFGLGTIISLVALDTLPISRTLKFLSWIVLVVSLVMLVIVHYPAVWVALFLFAVVSLIYKLSFKKEIKAKSADEAGEVKARVAGGGVSVASVLVLVVSLVLIIGGTAINNRLAARFNIVQLEVRPNWTSTFTIMGAALKKDPILGAGPNQFVGAWLLNKPSEVNSSLFWSTDFAYGVGLLPTYVVTNGLLGLLAWIFFIGSFIYLGAKAILTPIKNIYARFYLLSSFLGALYLWIFNLIYVPGVVMHLMTFIFTGVFLAALVQEKIIKVKEVEYSKDPRFNFATVLVLVLLIIGSVSVGYLYLGKYVSSVYASKAAAAVNDKGDIATGEKYLVRAINMNLNEDEYYRVLTDLEITKLGVIANTTGVPQDDLRAQFQNTLTDALNSAQRALRVNDQRYENWVMLGRVYDAIVPLNVAGSYESAKTAYDKALGFNPKNPAIYLLLARLEAAHNDGDAARKNVEAAMALKPDYSEGLFFLAQLDIAAGNIKGAIKSVTTGAELTPNNPTVFFQLGFLKYSDKDYTGAVESLQKAISLNSSYSNARYFLGLSYQKLGDNKKAIEQFVEIEKLNADNAEVKAILANLRAGRAPFAATTVAPEKRKTLPVKEEAVNPDTESQ